MSEPIGEVRMYSKESIKPLLEQYDKLLMNSLDRRNQVADVKEEYIRLEKELETFSDEIEYDAMVPIAKKAFCKGKIIHTNEILCLLGDSWFIKCSAKHARELAARRSKHCANNIAIIDKEIDLFSSWRIEVQREGSESLDGTVEIVEEYDEEREKQWRTKHAAKVREYKLAESKEKQNKCDQGNVDEELWRRLEELEIEEELLGTDASSKEKKKKNRIVIDTDKNTTMKYSSNEICSKTDNDSNKEHSQDNQEPDPTVILFHHSPKAADTEEIHGALDPPSPSNLTPRDLPNMIPTESSPKSILKVKKNPYFERDSKVLDTSHSSNPKVEVKAEINQSSQALENPLVDKVTERPPEIAETKEQLLNNSSDGKPISLYKLRKMRENEAKSIVP